MNPAWTHFLQSQLELNDQDPHLGLLLRDRYLPNALMPIQHLSVLKVSGSDAGKFLQGQVTCNVNDISNEKSCLGAFCNPKGRAIATFLLIKTDNSYLLVLPIELVSVIQTRLGKFVLRSDVAITDCSSDFCLFGTLNDKGTDQALFSTRQNGLIQVEFSATQQRTLLIGNTDRAIAYAQELIDRDNFTLINEKLWRYYDIRAGIPWLGKATSEEFIPQMLNLDQMGGISFNKGCYTGQEIVARTHYLGKAKRTLYLAESEGEHTPQDNAGLINHSGNESQVAGHVVQAVNLNHRCFMQVVLNRDENLSEDLVFTDRPDIRLHIQSFIS